jgi:hypothetical protein
MQFRAQGLRVQFVPSQLRPYVDCLTWTQVQEIDQWVTQLELGRRTAYDHWRLRDSAAVTAFMLRWN